VDTARNDALQAARQHVPEVLSYSFDTLDKDLDTASQATTGSFSGELSDLQRTVIRPSATTDKISTKTTVSDAGVVRADEQEVVVLAFINQLTTSQKQTTPRIDGARVRVTMAHVGDGWLLSRLDPL
jgi:Mce-associated membrane protein